MPVLDPANIQLLNFIFGFNKEWLYTEHQKVSPGKRLRPRRGGDPRSVPLGKREGV